jgi:hypothetical protein
VDDPELTLRTATDVPGVFAMQDFRVLISDVSMATSKLALVVAYDPLATPPVALKPVSVLFTATEPGANVTVVGEADAHLIFRVTVSLPVPVAKLAQESVLGEVLFIFTESDDAVTAVVPTVQELRLDPVMVVFSLAVPFGTNGGLKLMVEATVLHVTMPVAGLAQAVPPRVAKLTTSPRGTTAARATLASFRFLFMNRHSLRFDWF